MCVSLFLLQSEVQPCPSVKWSHCCLFHDAFIIWIVRHETVDNWKMMNWWDFRRKRECTIGGNSPEFAYIDLRKPQKLQLRWLLQRPFYEPGARECKKRWKIRRCPWRALMGVVTKLRVPQKAGNFTISRETIHFQSVPSFSFGWLFSLSQSRS
jgi:hypothetical protein